MFNDINEVMEAIESLTNSELTQLGVLAVIEHLAGNITAEQFEAVALVVVHTLEKRDAEQELAAGATVN